MIAEEAVEFPDAQLDFTGYELSIAVLFSPWLLNLFAGKFQVLPHSTWKKHIELVKGKVLRGNWVLDLEFILRTTFQKWVHSEKYEFIDFQSFYPSPLKGKSLKIHALCKFPFRGIILFGVDSKV